MILKYRRLSNNSTGPRFSLEFPLIDGHNETIGNWNFTLEKFFHNTSIIYQIFTVTINIIGSSSYTNGKFLSSNILQSIFNFLSAIFEVTGWGGILKLVNSCELREAIVETTGEQAQAHLHLSHLCEEAMHSPTLDLFLQPPPDTKN